MVLNPALKLASFCLVALAITVFNSPAAISSQASEINDAEKAERPHNSLRSSPRPNARNQPLSWASPESPSEFEQELSRVFSANTVSEIGFEIRLGVLTGKVWSRQQLADFAYADDIPNSDVADSSQQDIIYDSSVAPASYDEVNDSGATVFSSGAFSAFSNIKVEPLTAAGNSDSSADPRPAIEATPLPSPQAAPETASQAPSPAPPSVQLPAFGPALPAEFSLDLPVAQQSIGDLFEEIQRQRGLLPDATENTGEEIVRRRKLLDESHNSLLQAKKFLKKDFLQKNRINTFEADKQVLQEKLAVDRMAKLPVGEEPVDELFAALEGFRSEMKELNARLHEVNKTELQHKVRLGEIPKDRAAARRRIGEIKKQLKNEELGEADTFVMIRLRAEELEREYRIESLTSESKLYELENRLLPLNDDLLAREVKILESEIEAWNHAANNRRRLDLEEEARLARVQVLDAAPSLRALATLNVDLTERRIKFTEQIRAATEEEIRVKELLNSIKAQHDNVEKSIIDSTLSQANGLLLVDIRRKMVRPFESFQRIRQINRELQQISLQRLQLNEQREGLSHPVEYAEEVLRDVHSPLLSADVLQGMAVEIIESIRQQYDQLSAEHHTYIDLLGKIVAEREELVGEIEATMEFVNQKSLWVRSAQPISVEQVAKSRYGLSKFFSPQQWTTLVAELCDRFVTKPHESAAGLVGLIALFTFSRKFKIQE